MTLSEELKKAEFF